MAAGYCRGPRGTRTGCLVLKRMVRSSTTSMAPSRKRFVILGVPSSFFSPVSTSSTRAEIDERPTLEEPTAGSAQRSTFHLTCSATKSSPLCHLTPGRRWKVQVLRSSEASQLCASIGRVTLSGPVIARYSMMWRAWFDISVQLKAAGSSMRCTIMATVSTPPMTASGSSGGKGRSSAAMAGAGRPAMA